VKVHLRFAALSLALFFGIGFSWIENSAAQLELPLTQGSSFSNLAVGNLDGNASNGLEVVAASADGNLRAYRNSGSLLWEATTPNVSCGSPNNRIHSSPAVGDLNGDGDADVVVGYGGVGGGDGCDGGVAAFDGTTGAALWSFSGKKFAKKYKYGARWFTVFATPALADVDSDGRLEVGFASFDRNVYLLNFDGSPRWFYNAADTVWSSPAFADVNGDRKLELIAATDISANKHLKPPTKNGGMIYAFKTASRSSKKKRIGFRDKSAYYWNNTFDQVPYSSPSIGDIVTSNAGAEIVIGSGCYFRGTGKWIKILSAAKGKLLRTIPTGGCSTSSVAIGDIRGDNSVSLVHLEPSGGGTLLTAYDPNNGQRIWSTSLGSGGASFQTPIIADIDGNGSPEILVARSSSILIFQGATGNPATCVSSSCRTGELRVGGNVGRATPTVVDLNGDSLPELLVNTSSGENGKIVIWSNLGSMFQTAALQDLAHGPNWPSWRGNQSRSGH